MRLMSFAATTQQMYDRTKTVTRRLDSKGYWLRVLKPGTLVCAVEKGQGIPKGGQIQRIGVIEIVDVRRECLAALAESIPRGMGGNLPPLADIHYHVPGRSNELLREGFPEWTGDEFVDLFCRINRCSPDVDVTRIEFKHRPDLSTCCGEAVVVTDDAELVCPGCGRVS